MMITRRNPSKALLIILFFLPLIAFSQSENSQGKIKIDADPRLESLIERIIRTNELRQTMPGFRVQLYSGLVRNTANEAKSEFSKLYPEIPSHLIYQQPNFKVRVGDFKTRLEALRLHEDIKSLFPSSFIVKDDVKLPNLVSDK